MQKSAFLKKMKGKKKRKSPLPVLKDQVAELAGMIREVRLSGVS